VISAEDIKHDPGRVRDLRTMPTPFNAGELQQFTCTSKWMKNSIADYSRTI